MGRGSEISTGASNARSKGRRNAQGPQLSGAGGSTPTFGSLGSPVMSEHQMPTNPPTFSFNAGILNTSNTQNQGIEAHDGQTSAAGTDSSISGSAAPAQLLPITPPGIIEGDSDPNIEPPPNVGAMETGSAFLYQAAGLPRPPLHEMFGGPKVVVPGGGTLPADPSVANSGTSEFVAPATTNVLGSPEHSALTPTSLAATPQAASTETRTVLHPGLPHGFPDPHAIMEDPEEAEQLLNSHLLQKLTVLPADVLLSLGPRVVVVGQSRVELTPYEQVMIKCLATYYSTLPDIKKSVNTLRLMQYMLHVQTDSTLPVPEHIIRETYNDLCMNGIASIVLGICELIIPKEAITGELFGPSSPATALFLSLTELSQTYPDGYSIYNMLGHITEGSKVCIEPIPELVHYNDLLEKYLDSICTGSGNLDKAFISLAPRSPHLMSARPQAYGVPPNIPATIGPHGGRGRGNARPAKPAEEAIVYHDAYDPSLDSGASTFQRGPIGYRPAAPFAQSLNPTLPTDPRSSLAGQSEPRGKTIIRDTTNFRKGMETELDRTAEVGSMHSLLLSLDKKMDHIIQAQNVILQKIAEQDGAIATLVATVSNYERNNVSTILREEPSMGIISGQTGIQAGSHGQGSQQARSIETSPGWMQELKMILSELVNFDPNCSDPAGIASRARGALVQAGDVAFANTFITAAVSRGPSRDRLIMRLKKIVT